MQEVRYGSVCSGIEAASVAWHPLGWQAAWLAEIEKFPSRVLAHHYPDVPNLGDMTQLPHLIRSGLVEAPDVLVGGTPCQAFSVAGLRQSLEDDRGQLSITYIHIADAIDSVRDTPCVVVWENVPGVLSTKDNAFGCFLAGLVGEDVPLQPSGKRWPNAGCVYGPKRTAAWRVLDAQYFGVAQRRRRVFVVASARDGFDPAAVLFESQGVRRDTAPSREARQTAPTIPSRSSAGGGLGTDFDCDGGLVCIQNATRGKSQNGLGVSQEPMYTLDNASQHAICMSTGQAGAEIGIGIGTTLNCNHEAPIVTQYGDTAGALLARHDSSPCADRGMNVVAFSSMARPDEMKFDIHTLTVGQGAAQAVAFTLHGADKTISTATQTELAGSVRTKPPSSIENSSTTIALQQMQARRLTPTECERLQGFPDRYTDIPGAADGPRYKALGNSMAVPVMRWIGERICSHL